MLTKEIGVTSPSGDLFHSLQLTTYLTKLYFFSNMDRDHFESCSYSLMAVYTMYIVLGTKPHARISVEADFPRKT
jgi:hypothetical protein